MSNAKQMNYLAPMTSTPGDFTTEGTWDDDSIYLLNDTYKAVEKTPLGWATLARKDVPGIRDCLYCGVETSRRPTCRVCDGSGKVECGFMFDTHPDPTVKGIISTIDKNMEYGGHSGSSYGWSMRSVESIAKRGWEAFMLNRRLHMLRDEIEDPRVPRNKKRDLWDIHAKLVQMIRDAEAKHKITIVTPIKQADMLDPRNFFKAIATDPHARAMIPDLDEQVSNANMLFTAIDKAKEDPKSWNQSAGFPYPCSCHRAKGLPGWCGVAGFGVPGCEH